MNNTYICQSYMFRNINIPEQNINKIQCVICFLVNDITVEHCQIRATHHELLGICYNLF